MQLWRNACFSDIFLPVTCSQVVETMSMCLITKGECKIFIFCLVLHVRSYQQGETLVRNWQAGRGKSTPFSLAVPVSPQQQLFPWPLGPAWASSGNFRVRFTEFSQPYQPLLDQWSCFASLNLDIQMCRICPLSFQVLITPPELISLYLQAQDQQLLPVIIICNLNGSVSILFFKLGIVNFILIFLIKKSALLFLVWHIRSLEVTSLT